MNVTKDIDIKMLKDMLGNMIERCQTSLKPKVELDYNTAIRIYDVLEETQIREERHQTLESACTFMEMEDGTQTNEMELHNKKDANGNILRSAKEGNDDLNITRKQMGLHEQITKMAEHLQRENVQKSSDTVPDCYGCYDDKGLNCNNCKSKESCVEDTEKRKEEDDDFI